LFTLLLFIIDEKEQHFANIDSIGDCVTSAERWPATDRNYSGPWTISTGAKKFMSVHCVVYAVILELTEV
jgi:hypothetical protein